MMRCLFNFNADLPNDDNVPCVRDVHGGVAADKKQVGAQPWSEPTAVGGLESRLLSGAPATRPQWGLPCSKAFAPIGKSIPSLFVSAPVHHSNFNPN